MMQGQLDSIKQMEVSYGYMRIQILFRWLLISIRSAIKPVISMSKKKISMKKATGNFDFITYKSHSISVLCLLELKRIEKHWRQTVIRSSMLTE